MVKKIYLLICFWLLVLGTYGQDIITRTDGVEIKAQELEVKPGQVSFKLFQVPDTLVYQISVQDVQTIKMADGSVRTFNSPGTASEKKNTPFNYETQSGRNMLLFYPLDLVYANATLAYERIARSGKMGFRVPVSFGLSKEFQNNFNEFRRNTRLGVGLEINYYPFGQGRLQYYFGSALGFRTYQLLYYTSINSPNGPQPQEHTMKAQMYSLAFRNGVYYQVSRHFILSADAGLGYRIFQEPQRPDGYYPENRDQMFLPVNFHLGFRF
ncbi:hypothetical protein AAE02nite_26030 [Adhaeribacter aerolatus]|uniref:Outer membrane protein beta-barrel domain-containing protein n=1 Tax=Adhaeribacter aerolatus TaxID=670289 RepID=A0A512AYZ9_9BACT|nr:hypothetical protein [Adhaeribacter aerolatus]GEO04939.1 hypothetical protein AAE02nite_26030 [Adhaeribacter aerolatus]